MKQFHGTAFLLTNKPRYCAIAKSVFCFLVIQLIQKEGCIFPKDSLTLLLRNMLAFLNSLIENIKISFIMDSTGKRHGFSAEDSAKAMLSPGSAFQPLMFQYLGQGYHLINSGWIAEDTVDAPEFGIPAPMIRYLSSMRARPLIDTLDFSCSRFESTISAQGTYHTKTQSGQNIRTNAVIAGYARLAMSEKLHIPIHFFGTNENKNTMIIETSKGNIEQKVRHYVTTNITLKKMVSNRGIYGPVPNVEAKSAKKSKVKKKK